MASFSIELRGLRLQLDCGRELLAATSLGLDARPVALVGANGVGKSSLCRAILGQRPPSEGCVLRQVPVRGLSVDVREASAVSLLEALGEAVSSPVMWSRLAELELADIDLDRSLATLSGGQRMRLALALAFLHEHDYLVLDEPEAHLDREARQWLRRAIAGHRAGLLLVSHDPDTLSSATRVLEFSRGRLFDYALGFEAYSRQRALEQDAAQRAARRAQSELTQERARDQQARERAEKRAAIGRRERAAGSQPALMCDFAQGRAERAEGRRAAEAQGRQTRLQAEWQAQRERLALAPRFDLRLRAPQGARAQARLRVRGLEVERGGRVLLRGLDLDLQAPRRLAVLGPNGCGKSSLLVRLEQKVTADATATSVRRVGQETRLPEAASLLDCLQQLCPGVEQGHLRERLSWFGFSAAQAQQPADGLSAGERIRLLFCAHLADGQGPGLLLLDEPDNALDLPARAVVQSALASYPGLLLVASHSRSFLAACGIHEALWLDGRGGWRLDRVD
ncbi:MAG: ATP-binding cassette domain-containing protein [Aquimonas sp.]|nr:ATP-binding cassette domain-containing protein [Aquimonas sp.]